MSGTKDVLILSFDLRDVFVYLRSMMGLHLLLLLLGLLLPLPSDPVVDDAVLPESYLHPSGPGEGPPVTSRENGTPDLDREIPFWRNGTLRGTFVVTPSPL